MVEATLNVYKNEPAITIYLRDVSQYVEIHKLYNEALQEKMKVEVEKAIVEDLANQLKKQQHVAVPVTTQDSADVEDDSSPSFD